MGEDCRSIGPRGVGYCLQISDLTAQKQAELHLRQTRRLDSVASLARTVSRELQGIFAIVHGNAGLLAANERRISRILDAVPHGSELAHEMQLFTGTVSTTRILLELSDVVEESCDFVEEDLPSQVRLTYSRADAALPVHVDAVQIRHCVFNLLMNTIDAMADVPGEIQVRTGERRFDPAREDLICGAEQPAGEYAFVRISDEGAGMDPATEERAFEPFFSTRHKDRGSGLPTVLGIARAHGASLALENQNGCIFTLYFPLERGAGSA
jgi:signal transduction histidine kinase